MEFDSVVRVVIMNVLLGILLLEECIMQDDDGDTEARTTKRARTDRPPVSTSIARWIELARFITVPN